MTRKMTDVNGASNHGGDDNDQSIMSVTSSPPPVERDALSALSRRKQKQDERVKRLIDEAKVTNFNTLDLSKMGLKVVPPELLELQSLQYLYMSENELTSLPDNFFDCLPDLMWLDLRQNYLASLPSTYIGRHQCLRSLLLEGNELKTLPLELGLVSTLNGLNIANNPLEFPPTEVIEKGTHALLCFMRELLKAKSEGRLGNGIPRIEDLKLYDTSDTDSNASESEHHEAHSKAGQKNERSGYVRVRSGDVKGPRGVPSDIESDLVGPVPLSASLHRPVSYGEIKQQKYDQIRKAGAMGTVDRQPKKKKKSRELATFPPSPPADRIQKRFMEERRLAQLRHLKEKQDFILQKRKNAEYLREWRDESRHLQNDKYREAMIYGGAKDPVDIAIGAPFKVEKAHMKVLTNEERIKQDVKETHERMRAMSPSTANRMEMERAARDRELARKLRDHTSQMMERRKKPKGTPQEEMMQAKRELQMAEQLQREIEARRKALEYRFTAFTGDLPH